MWSIGDYLNFRGRSGLMEADTLALQAAVRLSDPLKQAQTRRDLARDHMALREWDEAIRQHELALGIAEEIGDEAGTAHGSLSLARVYSRIGKLYEEQDSDFGRAVVGDTMGFALAGLGRLDESIASYHQSVELLRADGRRLDMADTLMSLATVQQQAGRREEARAS